LPRLCRPQWGQAGPDRERATNYSFSLPRLRRSQWGQAGPDRERATNYSFSLPRLRRPQWGQPDRERATNYSFSLPRLRRPQWGQAGPDRDEHPIILFLSRGCAALSPVRLGLTGTSNQLFFFSPAAVPPSVGSGWA